MLIDIGYWLVILRGFNSFNFWGGREGESWLLVGTRTKAIWTGCEMDNTRCGVDVCGACAAAADDEATTKLSANTCMHACMSHTRGPVRNLLLFFLPDKEEEIISLRHGYFSSF
jgi:hypothetical protein